MLVRKQKVLTALAVVALLHSAPIALVAVSDHPDFSGTWVLNESRSDSPPQFEGRGPGGSRRGPGGAGGPGGGRGRGPGRFLYAKLIVKQEDDAIHVFPEGGDGEEQRALSFQPGAGPQEISTPRGPATVEARWDGSELVIHQVQERETPRGTMTMKQQQRWTLSEEGKTLTQEIEIRTPMRDLELLRVFDKE